MQVTIGPRKSKTSMAQLAKHPAPCSTHESFIDSLVEPFNHSCHRCHLEPYYLPDMLGAGKHGKNRETCAKIWQDITTLPYEDFCLLAEQTSHYNIR